MVSSERSLLGNARLLLYDLVNYGTGCGTTGRYGVEIEDLGGLKKDLRKWVQVWT